MLTTTTRHRGHNQSVRRPRRPILIAGLWAVGTLVALAHTLPAVQPGKDFDGLNNLLQIPFALPWFLLPLGTTDHVRDAWVAGLLGVLNSALLFLWLRRRGRPARNAVKPVH